MIALLMSALFTATCGAPLPANQCEFNATGSTTSSTAAVVKYKWDWGDGRTEIRSTPTTRNTWAVPGTYKIVLVVTDAGGRTSTKTQYVVVGQAVPGGIVHDTIFVQSPPPAPIHDTVWVAMKVDTVWRTDTLRIVTGPVTPPPPTPGRIVVEATPGEWLVWQNGALVGRLVAHDLSLGTWWAHRFIPGQMQMPCLSVAGVCTSYPSQGAARDALP